MKEPISRRWFLQGALLLVAAPAIVRASSLMPVKAIEPIYFHQEFALGYVVTGLDGFGNYITEQIPAWALREGNQFCTLKSFKHVTEIRTA